MEERQELQALTEGSQQILDHQFDMFFRTFANPQAPSFRSIHLSSAGPRTRVSSLGSLNIESYHTDDGSDEEEVAVGVIPKNMEI